VLRFVLRVDVELASIVLLRRNYFDSTPEKVEAEWAVGAGRPSKIGPFGT
jgi:hypothetical protein